MKTLEQLILSDEIKDKDNLLLYDNSNAILDCGKWYEDSVLRWYDCEVLCHWREGGKQNIVVVFLEV